MRTWRKESHVRPVTPVVCAWVWLVFLWDYPVGTESIGRVWCQIFGLPSELTLSLSLLYLFCSSVFDDPPPTPKLRAATHFLDGSGRTD